MILIMMICQKVEQPTVEKEESFFQNVSFCLTRKSLSNKLVGPETEKLADIILSFTRSFSTLSGFTSSTFQTLDIK